MFYLKKSSLVIRNIPLAPQEVYLTFDDGPCLELTEKILQILKELNARATFFVIVNKAKRYPEIIKKILSDGHKVCPHSLDHSFKYYFKSQNSIANWIKASFVALESVTGLRTDMFRPPAGVITPPLVQVAQKIKIRIFLWNIRFYDTVFCWSIKKADKCIKNIASGDIVLLHDHQPKNFHEQFLLTLRYFINSVHAKNLKFNVLP